MDILKIAIIACVTIVLSNILKEVKPEFSRVPLFLLSLYILGFSAIQIKSGLDIFSNSPFIKSCSEYLALFLKLMFISIMTDFVSSISEDNGNQTLSLCVSIFGRISMIGIVLPLAIKLLSTIEEGSLYGTG